MNQPDHISTADQETPAPRWGLRRWVALVVLGLLAAVAVGMVTSALSTVGVPGLVLSAAAVFILAPYMAARTMLQQFPQGAPTLVHAALVAGLVNLLLAGLAITYIGSTIEICLTGC